MFRYKKGGRTSHRRFVIRLVLLQMALETLVDIDRCMLTACYGNLLLLKNQTQLVVCQTSFLDMKVSEFMSVNQETIMTDYVV